MPLRNSELIVLSRELEIHLTNNQFSDPVLNLLISRRSIKLTNRWINYIVGHFNIEEIQGLVFHIAASLSFCGQKLVFHFERIWSLLGTSFRGKAKILWCCAVKATLWTTWKEPTLEYLRIVWVQNILLFIIYTTRLLGESSSRIEFWCTYSLGMIIRNWRPFCVNSSFWGGVPSTPCPKAAFLFVS